jgi:deoxyribonuclease V
VCYSKATDRCYAAVVVVRLPGFETLATATAAMRSPFPYVPGLLSFREAPPLIAALRRLRLEPDVLLFDAQGLAHPRRFGLASHLGLLYDRPSVGCAKTRLCGVHSGVGAGRGAWTPLRDEATGETIGSVLRTRDGVAPVYVSVGHRATDEFARALVLRCCGRWRLPEPIRLAHALSNRLRRQSE